MKRWSFYLELFPVFSEDIEFTNSRSETPRLHRGKLKRVLLLLDSTTGVHEALSDTLVQRNFIGMLSWMTPDDPLN